MNTALFVSDRAGSQELHARFGPQPDDHPWAQVFRTWDAHHEYAYMVIVAQPDKMPTILGYFATDIDALRRAIDIAIAEIDRKSFLEGPPPLVYALEKNSPARRVVAEVLALANSRGEGTA